MGTSASASSSDDQQIAITDVNSVKSLSFRQLQRACVARGLPAVGSTAALRSRLLDSAGLPDVSAPAAPKAVNGSEDECIPYDIEFCDEGDPDFEYKSLIKEANELASDGKWKTATRRLKKLKKRHVTPEKRIPQETYVAVLEACAADRLHGARASEPARKILEDMSEEGYSIPSGLGNGCIASALGNGPGATHDGFGGAD